MINNKYPNISPSLNLDFTNSNTIDPRITFSRASAATYYDGRTTAKAEENLLVRSQEFDNASWGKLRTDVLNVYTAPDGTLTAKESRPDEALDRHFVYQWYVTGKAGKSYTASVYVRATGYNYFAIGFEDNTYGAKKSYIFDLLGSSATLLYSAGDSIFSNASATITSVGGGWFRCTMTATCVNDLASYLTLQLGPSPTATPTISHGMPYFAGDGNSGVYVWGAQLEQRSQVTAYTPTTTQPITNYIPVLQTALSGVPRIDHDPLTGECKGLLIEEQRTNLLKYSEQFDNAAWVKSNTTVLPNTLIAPDGTLTAASVRFNLGLANDRIDQPILSIYPVQGSVYTYSVWLKGSGTVCITVNTSDGTGGSSELAITLSNTWQRYSVSHTFLAGVAGVLRVHGLIIRSASNPTVGVWGAQLEAGSFPTSYIKTEASQVTRAADSAQMTGANFSSWYRQDEGSLAVQGSYAMQSGFTNFQVGFPGNAGFDFVSRDARFNVNGTTVAFNTLGSTNSVYAFFVSGAYKNNDFSSSLNGSVVTTSSAARVGVASSFVIFANINSGHIKRITYYPKRLTDAQLQALTT